MLFDKISKSILTPSVLAEKDHFLIKLADTEAEVEQALRLRYKVFNQEQGKGLEESEHSGIDQDEFDEFCLHLVVVDKCNGIVVGTYRIHLGMVASSAIGFYSAREFKIEGLENIASRAIEVGRSCVSPEYRSGAVVALLWRGITELLLRAKMQYLLGCVSLETVDPLIGWSIFQYLQDTGKICSTVSALPGPGFELAKPSDEELSKVMEDRHRILDSIPPLFKGYLRLGTKICGPPALDYEFKTIDFLILLDTFGVPERYSRHFNYETEEV